MCRRCFYCGVLLTILTLANGFNLSPNYAQVFDEPQQQVDSYFGYSIGLQKHTSGSFWLVVGAPKANSSLAAHSGIIEPGVVYTCTTLPPNAGCSPVLLDTTVNEVNRLYSERKDHSWIGAAIDVTADGGLLACAPKWINRKYTDQNKFEEYLTNGICYWKDAPSSNVAKLMPLVTRENQGIAVRDEEEKSIRKFYYAYGQAGFSAHITMDGNELLFGAPGILEWIGTVIRCTEEEDEVIPNNRRRRQIKSSGEDRLRYDIPNPYLTSELDSAGYFGYSVSSGHFMSPNKISYVGGAPREATLKGSVSIFDYGNVTNSLDKRYVIQITLEGKQLGEYFGAALCVLDLNNDRLDDLVVGAPLHSLEGSQGSRSALGDEGRVYVFINDGNGMMKEIGDETKIMGMKIRGARFGTCVSQVGDLNKDGFNDFAVGAPFENEGNGAIYIYHGTRSGVNPRFSQRIAAHDIHPALSGFGYSISKGLDIDNNSYNDVAVGAFSSGHAVLVRSRPVITFSASLGNDDKKVGINDTGFEVAACLRYQGQSVPPRVDVQIFLSVVSKTEIKAYIKSQLDGDLQNNTYSYFATLRFNTNSCKTVQVVLVKGKSLREDSIDYTKPFEMKMSYAIDERMLKPPRLPNTEYIGDTFCKKCPVVDPNGILSATRNVPYATGCKNLICQTDLQVSASFEDSVRSPYIIGTRTIVRMKIVVENSGESAFLAKLNVKIPRSTPLVRMPPRCQEVAADQQFHLECDLDNPLRQFSQAPINLEMSFNDLSSSLESLSYYFNATSSGFDDKSENNVQNVTLQIQSEADLEIVGVSTQNELVFLPGNTQTFSHTYEVINYGPSPASAASLEFRIPVGYEAGGKVISFVDIYEPTLHLNGQPFGCKAQGLEFSVRKEVDSEENLDSSARMKRSTTNGAGSKSPTNDLPMNMTLHVNCTDPAIKCVTVKCDPVGPFNSNQSRALLSFKMKANLTRLAPILGSKDIIVVTSSGSVAINPSLREKQPADGRADHATVATVFYGTIREQPLAAWIWIVAIVGGIGLLLVVTGVLYKVGFFKRKVKEDLQDLKDKDCIAAQLDSAENQGFEKDNEIEGESEVNTDGDGDIVSTTNL